MEHNNVVNEEIVISEPKKDILLPMSILIAAVLVSGAVVFSTLYRPTGSNADALAGAGVPTAVLPGGNGAAPTAAQASIMTLGPRDAVFGNANAPVTIIEYGDFQCPYCIRFFTDTQPSIISNYVNAGKAKMVFRNYAFLGPESIAAAEAFECAQDQNKAWTYHDALYQAKADMEANGGHEGDGSLNRTLFLKLAGQVGMNLPAFTSCIDSNKYKSTVTDEATAAAKAGVNSTPMFFMNGTQLVGAQPFTAFQGAIDAALKK